MFPFNTHMKMVESLYEICYLYRICMTMYRKYIIHIWKMRRDKIVFLVNSNGIEQFSNAINYSNNILYVEIFSTANLRFFFY